MVTTFDYMCKSEEFKKLTLEEFKKFRNEEFKKLIPSACKFDAWDRLRECINTESDCSDNLSDVPVLQEYTRWNDLCRYLQRRLLETDSLSAELVATNKLLKRKGRIPLDVNMYSVLLNNRDTRQQLADACHKGIFVREVELYRAKLYWADRFRSRKDISNEMFREGVLHPTIMRLKRDKIRAVKDDKMKGYERAHVANSARLRADRLLKFQRQFIDTEAADSQDRYTGGNQSTPSMPDFDSLEFENRDIIEENILFVSNMMIDTIRRENLSFEDIERIVIIPNGDSVTLEFVTRSTSEAKSDFGDEYREPDIDDISDNPIELLKGLMNCDFSPAKRIVVSLINLIYQITRARNWMDMLSFISQFILAIYPSIPDFFMKSIIDNVAKYAGVFLHLFETSKPEISTESLESGLNWAHQILALTVGSEVTNVLRDMTLSLISMKFLGKDVSRSVVAYLGHPEKMSFAKTLSHIIKGFEVIVRYGKALLNGTKLTDIIMAEDPVAKFISDSKDIQYYVDRLYSGLPVSGMKCQMEFLCVSQKLFDDGNSILKTMVIGDDRKKIVKDWVKTHERNIASVRGAIRSKTRPPPVGIVLHGNPEIGKSLLLQVFPAIWSKVKGRPFNANQIFSRDKTSEYWEGYIPESHPFIHYSEIGNMSREQAKRLGDAMLVELNSLIDGLAFNCNMAFEGKGKIFAYPEMVLVDTNNPTMHIDSLMFCPAALYRRFIFVQAVVRDEFRKDDSTALDVQKSIDAGGNYLDRYHFVINEYLVNGKKTKYHVLKEGDIYALTEFFTQYFRMRIDKQEKVNEIDICQMLWQDKEYINLEQIVFQDTSIREDNGIVEFEEKDGDFVFSESNEFENLNVQLFDIDHEEKYVSHDGVVQQNVCNVADLRDAETSDTGSERIIPVVLEGSEDVMYGLLPGREFYDRIKQLRDKAIELRDKAVVEYDFMQGRVPEADNFITYLDLVRFHDKYVPWFIRFFAFFTILFKTMLLGFWRNGKNTFLAIMVYFDILQNSLLMMAYRFVIHNPPTGLGWNLLRVTLLNAMGLRKNMYWCFLALPAFAFTFSLVYACDAFSVQTRFKRYLYRLQMRLTMEKLSSLNPFRSDLFSFDVKFVLQALSLLAGGIATHQLYLKISNRKRPVTETSIFRLNSEYNEPINAREEVTGVQQFGRKVQVKDASHPVFNIVNSVSLQMPHTGTLLELYAKVFAKHVKRARVWVCGKDIATHVVGVMKTYALINTHALCGFKSGRIWLSKQGSFDDVRDYSDIPFGGTDLVDLGNDVSMIDLKAPNQFKDITKHFLSCIPPNVDLFKGIFNGKEVRVSHHVDRLYPNNKSTEVVIDNYFMYEHPHGAGWCGLPLLGELFEHSNSIFGIHSAGNNHNSYCYASLVTREMIEYGRDKLESVATYMPVFSSGPITQSLEMPIPKSPFNFEYLPDLYYHGKLEGSTMIHKYSKLRRTRFSPSLAQFFAKHFDGFVRTEMYTVPQMKPEVKKGVYLSPYNLGLQKMNNEPPILNKRVMRKVICVFVERILRMLREAGFENFCPLSLEQACNGVADDPFISRINAATSGGFGFKGVKAEYMPIVCDEACRVVREVTDPVKQRILEAFSHYDNEECVGYIVNVQLKDEPRLQSKVDKGNTRLFYISPLDNLILARMYLAVFYSAMVSHGYIFCTAVGINMHTQSNNFMRRLFKFSQNFMEGDYGGFDVANPLCIARAASTVVYKVLEAMGYNSYALKMVQGVLSDGLYPLINMNNDLFMKPGMQPSGKYATAEDNSLRGIIMLMYAWYAEEHTADLYFFDYVLPVVYGDDMVAAVDDRVTKYFNNVTYQFFCRRHYDMEFTSASKEHELKPFVRPEDLSFLKRKFVFKESKGVYEGCLSLDSIYKSLEWTMPSRFLPEEQQMLSTLISMLWELYFHATDEYHFNSMRDDFIGWMVDSYDGPVEEYQARLPAFFDIDSRLYGNDGYNVISESLVSRDAAVGSEMLYDRESFSTRLVQFVPNRKTGKSRSPGSRTGSRIGSLMCNKKIDYYNKILDMVRVCEAQLAQLEDDLKQFEWLPDQHTYARSSVIYSDQQKMLRVAEELKHLDRISDVKVTLDVLRRRLSLAGVSSESEENQNSLGMPDPSTIYVQENVMDMGGLDEKEVVTGVSSYMRIGQDEQVQLSRFFARPVEIDNFEIGIDDIVAKTYSIWDIWSKTVSVRSKLKQYSYFSGDLHVKIEVSGTPFHFQKIIASYQPYAAYNANLQAYAGGLEAFFPLGLITYLSQAPGVVMLDVKNNKPIEMVCPFISPKPMFRLYNYSSTALAATTSYFDFQNAGTLYLRSLMPLRTASPTESPISVQVYVWAENVNLGTTTATHIEISTESDERVVGPIERMATSFAYYSNMLRNIPSIAPLAAASTMLFRGTSGVAAWFGWSSPALITEPSFMKNEPYRNGAQLIRSETCKRITCDPKQELTVDPRIMGVDHDELSIQNLSSIKSFLTQFEWAEDDVRMAEPLFKVNVNPAMFNYVITPSKYVVQPTALAFVAAPFLYWHGTIKFWFDVMASDYHRGKLLIYWEPNIEQGPLIDLSLALNKNFMCIVDIQQTQSFEVCVEWGYPRAWAPMPDNATAVTNLGPVYESDSPEVSNGYLAVVPFTELTSPNDTNVMINVFVSCDDLLLQQPSHDHLPVVRDVSSESFERYTWGNQSATSMSINSESMEFSNDVPVPCFTLNKASIDISEMARHHFGEAILSLRTLLKRYSTGLTASLAAAPGDEYIITTQVNTLRHQNPEYGGTHGATFAVTLSEYLPFGFVAMRGGVRYRYHRHSSSNNHPGFNNRVVVHIRERHDYEANAVGWSNFVTTTDLRGTVSFIPTTNGGIEFEVPFYNPNLFVLSFSDVDQTFNPGEFVDSWSRQFRLDDEVSDPAATLNEIKYDVSMGEDFTYMRFCGAPAFSFAL